MHDTQARRPKRSVKHRHDVLTGLIRMTSFLLITCFLVLAIGGCSTATESHVSTSIAGQASYLSDSGAIIQATYYTNNTVSLKISDDYSLILPIAVSGSGARYANEHHEWWEHQGEARYAIDGTVVFIGKIQE